MGKRRWIMWQGLLAPSLERCILSAAEDGFALDGLLLQTHAVTPYVARYSIQLDPIWRTRKLELELDNRGRRTLLVNRDAAGQWTRDGQRLHDFDDCIDIDLEWSPSTNTLPIRRLDLAIGQTATLSATWIRFPSLEIERLEQSYERLSDERYRYRSGRFMADLTVDPDGLVLQYGVIWNAVATSGEPLTLGPTAAGPATGTGP